MSLPFLQSGAKPTDVQKQHSSLLWQLSPITVSFSSQFAKNLSVMSQQKIDFNISNAELSQGWLPKRITSGIFSISGSCIELSVLLLVNENSVSILGKTKFLTERFDLMWSNVIFENGGLYANSVIFSSVFTGA
jgi:hypothetical protein